MEGNRLDLDAPLLSFRRITAPSACEKAALTNPLRRKGFPLVDADQKLGQVGSAGAVPFDWEKSPGQPKDSSVVLTTGFRNPVAPKLPPGRSLMEDGADWLRSSSTLPESETVFPTRARTTSPSDDRNKKVNIVDEEAYLTERVNEDGAFSDARDAFSCAELLSMKCSMSAGGSVLDHSRNLTKDLQLNDFMMDRFLPAAQAMAAGSLQRAWRKPRRAPVAYSENYGEHIVKSRLPLDYQYQLSRSQLHSSVPAEDVEEEDDDDETYAGSGFLPSNACGLIHRLCLGSSFGLSNAGPGIKAQRYRIPVIYSRHSPQTEVLSNASLGQTKAEDSWEAVYRHKRSHGCHPYKGEERKLSESNQLTSWSDSQLLDGSSFINSSASAQSLDKHEETKKESGSWSRGSPGSCENGHGQYWETTSSHERLQRSGSTSPANRGLLGQEYLHLQETADSKFSENMSLDTKAVIKYNGNSSLGDGEFQQTDGSVVSEIPESHALQSRSSKFAEPDFSSCCERLNGTEVDGNDLDNTDDSDNYLALKESHLEKDDDSLTLSLLPPPLPTSPSDSWLQRTLPSVSSNGPHQHQQSFLGIQLHSKKQSSRASACDYKSITYGKPSKMQLRRTRFAEVSTDT